MPKNIFLRAIFGIFLFSVFFEVLQSDARELTDPIIDTTELEDVQAIDRRIHFPNIFSKLSDNKYKKHFEGKIVKGDRGSHIRVELSLKSELRDGKLILRFEDKGETISEHEITFSAGTEYVFVSGMMFVSNDFGIEFISEGHQILNDIDVRIKRLASFRFLSSPNSSREAIYTRSFAWTHVPNLDTVLGARNRGRNIELQNLRQSVVVLRYEPPSNRKNGKDFNRFFGCTAWRFSDTVFATAAHCIPEIKKSCEDLYIGFDYKPQSIFDHGVEGDIRKWSTYTESCKEILYFNRALDVAFFRVSKTHHQEWGKRPILPVLNGAQSFPDAKENGRRVGEKLLILHHPAPRTSRSSCWKPAGSSYQEYGPYQIDIVGSLFSKAWPNNLCRLKLNKRGRASFPISWNREAKNDKEMEWEKGNKLPTNAIYHLCSTCPGSSGSPVISMQSNSGRYGTVVGVHHGGTPENFPYPNNNVAIRMSAIADCLEISQSVEADDIIKIDAASDEDCKLGRELSE